MKSFKVLASSMVFAVSALSFGQAGASPADLSTNHGSDTEARHVKPNSHTREECTTLAAHLRLEETAFRKRASEEKHDWEQRSQITTSLYAKYPRPADSARNLYEYYTYQANKKRDLAVEYEEIASAPQNNSTTDRE